MVRTKILWHSRSLPPASRALTDAIVRKKIRPRVFVHGKKIVRAAQVRASLKLVEPRIVTEAQPEAMCLCFLK